MSLYPPIFILFIFMSNFGFLCLYFESDFKSDFESNFESDFESNFEFDFVITGATIEDIEEDVLERIDEYLKAYCDIYTSTRCTVAPRPLNCFATTWNLSQVVLSGLARGEVFSKKKTCQIIFLAHFFLILKPSDWLTLI